jgi:hypothetical protein
MGMRNKYMHNNEFCHKYKDKVLPDEDNNCSLCGAKILDIIFEDSNIYLLSNTMKESKRELYIIETKPYRILEVKYYNVDNTSK